MKGIIWATSVIIVSFLFFVVIKKLKRKKELSFFHYLWFLLLVSTFTLRGRTTVELLENPLDYAGIFRLLLVSFAGGGAFIYILNTGLKRYLRKSNLLAFSLLLYSLMGIFSFIYSPIPKLSIYKSMEVLISLSIIMIFIKFRNLYRIKILFDIGYLVLFLLISSAWFWALIKPEVAITRMGYLNFILTGYFPKQDADMVSVNAALLAIGTYVRMRFFPKNKSFYKMIFFFSIATLVAGQAKTSIFGFLAALAFIYFIMRENIKLFLMLSLIGISISFDRISNAIYKFLLKGSKPEIVMRFGGRLEWWKLAFPYFLTSPIWGHGFAAGIRGILLEYNPDIFTVHNSFLEIAVNLGIIGLFLFSFAYFGSFYLLVKVLKQKGRKIRRENPLLFSLILEGIGLMIVLTARASTSFTQGEHGTGFLIFLSILGLSESLKYFRGQNEKSSINSLRM